MNAATPALSIVEDQPHISWETWNFMRQQIAQLTAENARLVAANAQLQRDLEVERQQTNHWYMRATYTPEQLELMYVRRSKGKNEFTAAWLTSNEQAAYDAMESTAAAVDEAPAEVIAA
jgi:hypothetical protein